MRNLLGVIGIPGMLAAAAAWGAAAPVALPLHIGGRVIALKDPAGAYSYQWPGTYFEARFKGKSVSMRVHDEVNMLDVYVDGQLVAAESRPGTMEMSFGPFADGEHLIRVEMRTESQTAAAQFGGFFVPAAADVLPAPAESAREMEFIGDSFTVGYGNTSSTRQCTDDEVWSHTDTQLAFGPLTAKHYSADYRVFAVSGRGMVRNVAGMAADTVPTAYPYAPASPAWAPQIIVIGLGENDFSTQLNPGEQWKSRNALHFDYEITYATFVKSLREKNPQAFFILTATDDRDGEIQAEVKKVVAGLQADGGSRVAFLPINALSFGACNYHPTVGDDAKIENLLIGFIDSHPELWKR